MKKYELKYKAEFAASVFGIAAFTALYFGGDIKTSRFLERIRAQKLFSSTFEKIAVYSYVIFSVLIAALVVMPLLMILSISVYNKYKLKDKIFKSIEKDRNEIDLESLNLTLENHDGDYYQLLHNHEPVKTWCTSVITDIISERNDLKSLKMAVNEDYFFNINLENVLKQNPNLFNLDVSDNYINKANELISLLTNYPQITKLAYANNFNAHDHNIIQERLRNNVVNRNSKRILSIFEKLKNNTPHLISLAEYDYLIKNRDNIARGDAFDTKHKWHENIALLENELAKKTGVFISEKNVSETVNQRRQLNDLDRQNIRGHLTWTELTGQHKEKKFSSPTSGAFAGMPLDVWNHHIAPKIYSDKLDNNIDEQEHEQVKRQFSRLAK